jgi:hypothetical protein
MFSILLATLLLVQNTTPPRANTAEGHSAGTSKKAEIRQGQQIDTAKPVPRPPQIDPEQLKRERDYRDREVRAQESVADLTCWLVVIGALLGISQVGLLFWTGLVSNKSANAALNSAKTAESQARIAREALIAVDRPFVRFGLTDLNVSMIAYEENTRLPQALLFSLPVINDGNTPTKNLRIHVNIHVADTELKTDFGFPDLGDRSEVTFLSIPPKGKIYSTHLRLERLNFEAVEKEQRYLYFYGWATYNDIFEGTGLHRTEFCYQVSMLRLDGDKLNYSLAFLRFHNSVE